MDLNNGPLNEFVPDFALIRGVRFARDATLANLLRLANLDPRLDLRHADLRGVDWRGERISEFDAEWAIFDTELPDRTISDLDFKNGDYVFAPRYGHGRITQIQIAKIFSVDMLLYVIRRQDDRITIKLPVDKARSVGLVLSSDANYRSTFYPPRFEKTDLGRAIFLISTQPSKDRLKYMGVLDDSGTLRRKERVNWLAMLIRDLAHGWVNSRGTDKFALQRAVSALCDEVFEPSGPSYEGIREMVIKAIQDLGPWANDVVIAARP